ncbi:MAG: 2'-deoxycytidine 5'-triphosphate deaminase, partial [Paracoccaceae bacterium]
MTDTAQGVLPIQTLTDLADQGALSAKAPFATGQIQPASLDLRLGTMAYRLRASFLPGAGNRIADRLADFEMHRVDLTGGAVLEKGCVYLVPLQEYLSLPDDLDGVANAKSSTGRLDLLTRTVTDGGTEFDRIPRGYTGPLYAEICPRSFSVLVRPGMRLNQLRLRRGQAVLPDDVLRVLHRDQTLVSGGDVLIDDGLGFSVDLRPKTGDLLGYRAKPHTGVIDLDRLNHYDPTEFWDRI